MYNDFFIYPLTANLVISPSWQLWIMPQCMGDCRFLHTVLISSLGE